jgi:ATP-binding cassette subfamily B protein/subfamily B ATP-binding cassette protein MsbA
LESLLAEQLRTTVLHLTLIDFSTLNPSIFPLLNPSFMRHNATSKPSDSETEEAEQLLKTSRGRYGKFLEKFKSGDFHSEKKKERDEEKKKKKPDAEEKRKRRGYLRLYVNQLWPHWKMVALLAMLAVGVSVLEIIQPLFARHIIDNVLLADLAPRDRFIQLNVVGGIFLLVVVSTRVLGVARAWNQRLLNVRVILTLRRALFDRLIKLPLDKLADMKVGGIISRLTDDINKTTGLLQMAVISPGVAVLRLLLAMVILFSLNWKLALTALGIVPPIMLLSMIAIKRIRPIYRAIRKDVSFVDGRVGEAFQGIRAVRAFGGEHRESHEYTIGHHLITRMRMFAARREIILWSTWGFLMALTGVVITWAGGYWYLNDIANNVPVGQRTTIGDISAFQFYTLLLLNPVWQIVESLTELQRSLASMERVFEVLETPIDKPDRDQAIEAPAEVEELKFENVWFAYNDDGKLGDASSGSDSKKELDANHDKDVAPEQPKDVIKNFSLTVPGGSIVALVGRSGAGKTTVTDMVARFYDPREGRMTLNGVDLRDYQLNSYRDLIGVVQQEVFLFDGTVFENIAYANRDATREQVIEAAKRANADEFIIELPQGYDSIIGERGVKLSGGQRQRLSIARALLADPQILILDEATSNLDTESEQLIQQSMTTLLKDRTTFVIAHRLSTITHADQIVVLDDGEIVELGTHESLMLRDGVYAKMVRRQHDAVSLI